MRSFTYLSAFLLVVAGCGDNTAPTADGGNGTDGSVGTTNPTTVDEWLQAHNASRANAGPPTPSPALTPLTWNDAAAATATAWAAGCTWMHNPNRGNFGENIAAFTGTSSPTATVQLWDGEKADYDYANNSCPAGKQCGHYTQLVWRNTASVGCSAASCTTGSPFKGSANWQFLVCDYAPPGNFNGQKPY